MFVTGPKVLALDAMGVIYHVGDDVAELLVPFIRERNPNIDRNLIEAAYTEASLGKLNAQEFWRRFNVLSDLEDQYLRRFLLREGVHDFLRSATSHFEEIVCLSNDVSEWSRKLRKRFDLERHVSRWYISGDLGIRKPAAEIYQHMLNDLNVAPQQVLFVDDRLKNLDAAASLGIQTMHFASGDADPAGPGHGHRRVTRLAELLDN